jgi:hypothetical protein
MGRHVDILSRSVDGGGKPEVLLSTPNPEFPIAWSRDGKYLACVVAEGGLGNIYYLRRKDAEKRYEAVPFVITEFDELAPSFSPDGRFLAYESNESGSYEVYVQPFPEGGRRWQVSTRGGRQPQWRGSELFYVEGDMLLAVPVTTNPDFRLGAAQGLFDGQGAFAGRGHRYDVAVGGQRFVMVETLEPAERVIHVVQNWYSEFRE